MAARENAVSDESIHELSGLVKKITLKDKIDESREFAGDVDTSLYAGGLDYLYIQKENSFFSDGNYVSGGSLWQRSLSTARVYCFGGQFVRMGRAILADAGLEAGSPLAPPPPVERRVAHDLQQPGPEPAPDIEIPQPRDGLDHQLDAQMRLDHGAKRDLIAKPSV